MITIAIAAGLLAAASGGAGAETAKGPDAKPDKVICRKFGVTGSLVRQRKVCHTSSEWKKLNTMERDAAQRFVDDHTGKPPGGP
ncbi:hypothetical protein [Sphingosinicella sp. LY1275]|uniref:hypothetical protein n=1 Tax=Sphingosinicella sp. LY1275 TaxID=3095379 RepID=UPI002ADEEDBE|nr:hypothetical protein [Sphingosinicella sp. LY1275]MEA1014556.1 hypothetical protein [Sphingosinicella sp. LY1275]